MTEAQIKHMVDRFLAWRLPDNFNPDNGVSVKRPGYSPEVEWHIYGTNLLDATQTEVMIRYIISELPE